jgi:hypothetical protein
MPNWCYNSLRIIGPSENIKDVIKNELSFQQYVPCAMDIESQSEEWGTKWGPSDFRVKHEGEFDCNVSFMTAWGPPIPFLEKLNEKMPECWFKLEWEVELGWGSGMWIHSLTPKRRQPVVKVFQWEEPPCYPMANGKFLLPCGDDSEDEKEEEKEEEEPVIPIPVKKVVKKVVKVHPAPTT